MAPVRGTLSLIRALGRDRFARRLAVIVLAALSLRIAYVIGLAGDRYSPGPAGDSIYFHDLANLIAAGRGFIQPFSLEHFHRVVPTAEHPPLWPLVLAFVTKLGSGSIVAFRLVSATLGAITVGLIGLLGRRLAGDRAGLLAGCVAAVHPLLVAADGSMLSETLFGLLALAALLAAIWVRGRPTAWRAGVLGALIGLAALTRGEGLLLILLLALPAVWRPTSGRGLRLGAAVLAAVVALAPWTIRNASAFHRLVPVSTNDGTLINGANCAPTYHGTLLGFWSVNCRSPISSPNEAKQSAKWAAEGIRYARRHPGRLLAVVVPVRIMRTLDLWRPAQQVDLAEGRVRWVEAAGQACFWLLVPLAVYGAVLMRRRRALLWPLGVPPLLALTMSVTGYGYPRFRFTADLVVTILAGVALAKLLPAGTRRRA